MLNRLKELLASERAIYGLVALFVLLGALYSVVNPIFEAGDELWHYPYTQWIARGNGLPVQDPTKEQLWEQEGGQPPLFYAASAALTFWIDTSDMQDRLWRNPYARIGIPLAFGNKNMVVHTSAEDLPWRGTTLAVHLIRFLSVLFSAGTVFLTWKVTWEVLAATSAKATPESGHRRAVTYLLPLLAACVVAFNPMFLFISASVNNDALAALLATGAIYLTVQLVTRGVTKARALALGVIVGLAILAKVSNLALGIVVMSTLAYCLWRTRDFKRIVLAGLLFLLPVAALTLWWFARNYTLYGDPLAFNVWMQIAGGRASQTVLGLLDEFQGFRISFWGNFGGVNVIAPEWVYSALDLFSVVAVVGLVIGAVRRTVPALAWIMALHVLIVFVALVRWTLMTFASQGRLMFPAIASISILIVFGLYAVGEFVAKLARGRSKSAERFAPVALPAALGLFLFVFASSAPFVLIAPVYAHPPRITDESAAPNPVHIKYDAGNAQPELLGYEMTRVLRGNELPLKLFWRTDAPIDQDLLLYIHVYDADGERIGQWDAFPGNGLLPTRLWQPNEIIVDDYRVPLTPTDAYPPLARVEVGLSRPGASRPLVARDPEGREITPTLGRVRTTFRDPKGDERPVFFHFGDTFDLLDFEFEQNGAPVDLGADPVRVQTGQPLRVKWTLRAANSPDADYKMFFQLVDDAGNVIAQRDAEPANGAFPTSYLLDGEVVTDVFELEIPKDTPPGQYRIIAGMYGVQDGARLPVIGAIGKVTAEQDHIEVRVEIPDF